MAEGQELPPLTKPTKHTEQVQGYVAKGAPEKLAREFVTEKILGGRREKRLEEQAMTDPLTGAYNRRYFDEQLRDAFALTKRDKKREQQIGVMILDLDRFKNVNDTVGHPEGDRVLKTFAETMKIAVREEDVFARFGGEEFAILIREVDKLTPDQIEAMATRFRDLVPHDVSYGPSNIPITVSIGLSLYPNGANIVQPEDLVKCADEALYNAKEGGRNQVVKFVGVDSDGKPQFSRVDVSPKG